jgi:hypothetical protein
MFSLSIFITKPKALMKEGPLEDYLSIAWQVPGKSREMVPGEYLYSCTDPNADYDGKPNTRSLSEDESTERQNI